MLHWADQSSQKKGRIKISCTGTMSPTNQPRKDLFHFYSISPHLPEFQQSAAVLGIRIRMFEGLPDPDPLVRGMDPDPSLFS